MAKKNSIKTVDLGTGKVTEEAAGAAGSQLATLPTVKHASIVASDASKFAALGGEVSFGMQIIKLKQGEAAGPFILAKILEKQDCTPAGAKKKYDPVDVYVGRDTSGFEIRMPIAASFVGKAADLKLAVGDEFHLLRMDDYHSKTYNKDDCQSFALAITRRAGKK